MPLRHLKTPTPATDWGHRMRREWWLREGGDARTPSGETGERLAEHMPELVPTWRRLTEMVDDEHAGAVLALTRRGP